MLSDLKKLKARVLYVDDEQENLDSFRSLFRRDYEVYLALSAAEALEVLKQKKIHVLVTDQRMPEMTGAELLEQAALEHPDVLRFMLTGYSDINPLVDAINKGKVEGYFSKPLDPDALKSRIERGLSAFFLKIQNQSLLEELQKNEGLLSAVYENIPDMIYVKDAEDLSYLHLNLAGEKLLGFSRRELIGKNDHDIFPEETADFFKKHDREALAREGVLEITEEIIQTNQKGERILFTKKIPIRDESGYPQYLLGISEDITDKVDLEKQRKSLENQLRQAQKMEAIGTLASGIAHDFNNILSPILGFTELVMMTMEKDCRNYQNLEAVLSAGGRARELVQQILTFSRQSEQELRPVHLEAIIKECVVLLRSSFPATITIHQNIDPNLGAVMADPSQLHQVVMNLCTNAYHAMKDQGGELEINLAQVDLSPLDLSQYPDTESGSYLKLSIRDTGQGILPGVIDRIFEPYFTTRKKGEGTGLGLSVVHGIIKSYKGNISVYSEPGQGTVFNIILPVAVPAETLSLDERTAPMTGGNEHILLVDDEKALVSLATQMLENLGYRVTSFVSSIEALNFFKEQSNDFDLAISDLTMPNITGLQLARELRQIKPEMNVLICTGFSEKTSAERADTLGIKGFVMKPIVMRDLAAAVRRALDD